MACLHSHCSYEDTTVSSHFIVVDLFVAVSIIKPLNVDIETQEWFYFVVFSSYKVFCTAVNSVNVLWTSCKVPCFFLILTKFGVSWQIFMKVLSIKFHIICPVGAAVIHAGRWTDVTGLKGTFHYLCIRLKIAACRKHTCLHIRPLCVVMLPIWFYWKGHMCS